MGVAATIGDQIVKVQNDYSGLEKEFRKATGRDVVHLGDNINSLVKDPISIVIPTYIGEHLNLVLQNIEKQIYRNFEVIIVDDGSPNDIPSVLRRESIHFPVKYIRILKNRGRSTGRNLGIGAADADIIVTIDSDIILPIDFTARMAARQHFLEKSLFVGFREDITRDRYIYRNTRGPEISRDWRYFTENNKRFLDLTVTQSPHNEFQKTFHLIKESNNFKSFGRGTSIGYWDLPCMVIGHSLCFQKDEAIKAGGFIENFFHGWGMEDIAFGASMIANGNFVVPALDWVSYHIDHERRSGLHKTGGVEFKRNLNVYLNQYLKLHRKELIFPRHALKKIKEENNINYYESEG